MLVALKSGQMAECTWALDVLTVMSRDDSNTFLLSETPGLIHILLEHIMQCLRAMSLYPVASGRDSLKSNSPKSAADVKRTPVKVEHDIEWSLVEVKEEAADIEEQTTELPDFTNITRQGLSVKQVGLGFEIFIYHVGADASLLLINARDKRI